MGVFQFGTLYVAQHNNKGYSNSKEIHYFERKKLSKKYPIGTPSTLYGGPGPLNLEARVSITPEKLFSAKILTRKTKLGFFFGVGVLKRTKIGLLLHFWPLTLYYGLINKLVHIKVFFM